MGRIESYLLTTKQFSTFKKDRFCALWSISAKLFPTITNQNSTSTFVPHFVELDKRGFDSTNGLKIEDVPRVESDKISKLTVFETNIKVDGYLRVTSQFLPISISDTESKPIDPIWYENYYCLNKKLHVFNGNHN